MEPRPTPPERSRRTFLVVVDDSAEMRAALRYACRRARHTGGRVALLRVVEPGEFQSFAGIGALMHAEARQAAEDLLQRMAGAVNEMSGEIPVLYVREGARRDEVLRVIDEEEISLLVLGAGTGSDGPGPLVSALTGRYVSRLRVPLTIVPGHLDDQAIDVLS